MYGRYGSDKFNFFLLIIAILLSFAGNFFFWPLTILSYLLWGYAIFRMLSKNIAARQRENYSFLGLWSPIESKFKISKQAFSNRKAYKYFKCPNCRQHLRAPRGRGKIMVSCQKCHKEFTTKT
jgi:hypothetical protein